MDIYIRRLFVFPENERIDFMKNKQQIALERLVIIAMLSAIAFVLFLLEFPVIPSLGHLKLDFSDIPALIAGLLFGPVYGVVVELIKNVIVLMVKGLGTQLGYGNIMNFIVGCAYVVPFSVVYLKFVKSSKRKYRLPLACVAGMATIVLIGIGANYFIAPFFFKNFLHIELNNAGLWAAVWGATAINAIKGVMLSVVSVPITEILIGKLRKISR